MGVKQRLAQLPVVGTALAVQERYKADGADPFAAAIGFFAFLSVFPLLLLAVSFAGFVLEDPADQVAVAEAITDAIPGFDATMQDGDSDSNVATLVGGAVDRRGTIGLVGALLLLLSGLRVINGAMIATRVVFRGEVQSGIMAKVRQVGALLGLGALALLGVAGSTLAGVGIGALPEALTVVLSTLITFALDVVLFIGAYTLLSPTSSVTARQTVPGAVLAATGWTALKVAGAAYVGNQVDSANALYGALGGVIALMLLLYLAGRLYLYGAELIAVQVERRHGPLTAPGTSAASAAPAVRAAPVVREPAIVGGDAGQEKPGVTGPPPVPDAARASRPVDPGPTVAAPTIGPSTRQQVVVADGQRLAAADDRDAGADTRQAIALGLGLAALAAGYRFLQRGARPS